MKHFCAGHGTTVTQRERVRATSKFSSSPLVPGDDVAPGADAGPLREAGDEPGEVLGEEHAAEGAAVEGGQRVEGLPLGLGQRVAQQRGDQPRVQLAVDAVPPVEQVLHLGRLVEERQTGSTAKARNW